MTLNNLKISRQIIVGISVILLITFGFALNTIISIDGLWTKTTNLFSHPLTVRHAIDDIRSDTYLVHWGIESALRQDNYEDMVPFLNIVEKSDLNIQYNFGILYDQYSGPKEDIDDLVAFHNHCKTNRTEVIRLLTAGHIEEAASINLHTSSAQGIDHLDEITSAIEKISDFADNKIIEIYQTSQQQRNETINQTAFLSILAILALLGIGIFLRQTIVPPINRLTASAVAIQSGKLDTRIQSEGSNEIGILAKAFNGMAEAIETEIKHKDNAAQISTAMFREDSLRQFCQELLQNLMHLTDSQIGAIYFLNQQENKYEPYESIGARLDKISSFSVTG